MKGTIVQGTVVTLCAGIGLALGACDPDAHNRTMQRSAVDVEVDPADTEELVDDESEGAAPEASAERVVSIAPEQGHQPPNSSGDITDEPRVFEAPGCHTRFSPDSLNCSYARVSTTGAAGAASLRADCDDVTPEGIPGYRVVHGGCWTNSSANLKVSGPDEGSQGNFPSVGDPWDTTNSDAWSCTYSASPGANQSHVAIALCCPGGNIQVASCEP